MNHEHPRASNAAQDSTTTTAIDATPVQRLIFRPPRIPVALLVGAMLIDGWLDWPRLFDWPGRAVGALSANVRETHGPCKPSPCLLPPLHN